MQANECVRRNAGVGKRRPYGWIGEARRSFGVCRDSIRRCAGAGGRRRRGSVEKGGRRALFRSFRGESRR
jgi:hypothetical protein